MDDTSRGRLKAKIKTLLRIALWAALAGAIAFFAISYYLLQKSLPPRAGTVNVPGLVHPTTITFDKMGIPQVWAYDELDAYYAIGYLHASDRLFQMEMTRRLSQGRISELIGEMALEYDIRQRQFQHVERAAAAVHRLDQSDRRRLLSYVNGINGYLATAEALPFEFYIMQARVEPWTIEDCLTLLIFQTWFSDALQNRDEFFVDLVRKFGEERARTLLFDYPNWAPTTIDPVPLLGSIDDTVSTIEASIFLFSSWINPVDRIRQEIYQSLFQYVSTPMRMSESSNAWVIAPSKSRSGKAMLASDPHLEISRLPQFWYCMGVHTTRDSMHVFGITTPGLPMFAMGHNGNAAWAFTAGGVDVTEFYEERINPNDSTQYLTPDGWMPFEVISDTFAVAGVDTLVSVVTRITRHGPVVIDDDSLNRCYSVRWAGLDFDPASMAAYSFALGRVQAFSHFRKIVTNFGALDANWVYADKHGTIGYQLGTPVPIRPAGVDNLPLPGWEDSGEWLGYQPLNMTPNFGNPQRGWLTSNNNKPERRSSYDLSGNYAADRILRATELLSAYSGLAPIDMMQMQMDLTDNYLLRWKPELADLLRAIGENDEASLMDEWDGTTALESRPTLVANLFLSQLTKLTFSDELGDDWNQVRKIWMDQYYHGDEISWFDDTTTVDTIETREQIAQQAMRQTLDLIGEDTWGNRNSITMRHPLAVIPILGSLLDLSYGPWSCGGSAGSLNASFFSETDDHHFKTFVAPSWRFVIDFDNVDATTVVMPAGVSGNPASPHFADFIDMWRTGERWVVPFSRALIVEQAASALILKPQELP